MLALDIETDGLRFMHDNIVAIGVMKDTDDDVTVFTAEDWQDEDDYFRAYLESVFETELIVVHNSVFDIPFICKYFGIPVPNRVWDTLVMERLLTAGLDLSVSLAEVTKRILKEELDKTQQTTFVAGKLLNREQIAYLKKDVSNLFPIRQAQVDEIGASEIGDVADIEESVTPVFLKMVTKGIPVNREKLEEYVKQVDHDKYIKAEVLWEKLTPHVMKERIAKYDAQREKLSYWLDGLEEAKQKGKTYEREYRDSFKRPPKPKMDESFINLDSPSQVQTALESLGIKSENTSRSAIKSILPSLSGENQKVVSDLLEYKRLSKLSNAFGEKLLAYLDYQGNLHGIFNQYGTDTGRPTCKEPNLLQIPATDEFRRLFYGGHDHSLVFADYAQMELRLVAELSRDAVMIQAFQEGLDLHSYTASLMWNLPYESIPDRARKIAKNINFMVLYGGGHNKLRSMLAPEGVFLSEQEARDAMDTWRKTYWRAAHAIKQWGEQAYRYGQTHTAFGRPRHFEVDKARSKGDVFRIQRQGANHVIQGTNADITKLAMVLVDDALGDMGYIALQIYDEIVVMAKHGHERDVMRILYHSMVAAAEEVLVQCPVGVECYHSPTWSEKDAIATYDGRRFYGAVA